MYFVCLNISAKFLIACNLLSPMDANQYFGDGFEISSIKYIAQLVADYWLGIHGIYCPQRKIHCIWNILHSGFVYVYCISSVLFHEWSQIIYLYPMWAPRSSLPHFLVYYYLIVWVWEWYFVEIKNPPNPLVLKVLGLILMYSIGSMWFGLAWGGGTIGALGKIFQHNIVPQWSGFYSCGWLDPLYLSCACVGEPIGMLLIVVCQKFECTWSFVVQPMICWFESTVG